MHMSRLHSTGSTQLLLSGPKFLHSERKEVMHLFEYQSELKSKRNVISRSVINTDGSVQTTSLRPVTPCLDKHLYVHKMTFTYFRCSSKFGLDDPLFECAYFVWNFIFVLPEAIIPLVPSLMLFAPEKHFETGLSVS